ncbi:MAG: NTP/NDP exchange transporter [Candidatus Aminicenantaceae bacterium]
MKNILKAIQDIPREKLPKALLMSSYFFLVITMFWVLKPMKKGVFASFYKEGGFNLFGWQMAASQAEQLAKVLNMVMAVIGVVVFTMLARRITRQKLVFIWALFFSACFVVYSGLITNPTGVIAWTFYLFGDFFNTIMVVLFWAFLNDIVHSEEAKRLYGIIGLGGVLGGWFGSGVVAAFVKKAGKPPLLLACIGGALLIMVIAFFVGRIAKKEETAVPAAEESQPKTEMPKKSGAAIEGAKLVFASRYLLAIVAIVGIYEIVSSIMDFQWTTSVINSVTKENLSAYFGSVYFVTNSVAVFVQLFLTSLVMRKFGVGIALLFLPIAALCSSTAFLIFPILMVGNALSVSDNGLNYSINQSSKEALYVPTTPEVKYRAKAFIDMFVMRFSKAIAVVINLVVTGAIGLGGIRWLAFASISLLVIWIYAVRYAGRQFRKMTQESTVGIVR